jgi:hypothetical protein
MKFELLEVRLFRSLDELARRLVVRDAYQHALLDC